MRLPLYLAAAALAVALPAAAQAPKPAPAVNHDLGFKDTPMLPGMPWHVHDPDRPHPVIVAPPAQPGGAPADAIVLFDGKDLSKWQAHHSNITRAGGSGDAEWKVSGGIIEAVPKTGDIATKQKFGDCQLHVEWSVPADVTGTSQARGNSGVILMDRYEIQVLDSYKNVTYADGQAAAIYGQYPPFANVARAPGDWNVYDIIFEAPRFEGDKVVKPAYFTVIWNGVVVHNHQASMGPMVWRQVAHYQPHDAEAPLVLQNHDSRVRYRNIWIRPLGKYDQPEK